MSAETKTAKRYAKAFYLLAAESKEAGKLETQIQSLKDFVAENDSFEKLASNTSLSVTEQENALQAIIKQIKFHDYVGNLLLVLNKNRRLSILEKVCEEILANFKAARAEVDATVSSAKELSKTQIKEITSSLSQQTGWNVNVQTEVNEELIGGLVIKIGSYMIDNSIQTKLEKAKRQLKGAA